ncbi:DNA polymerase III subunit epsilon [Pasteurellaceae bacterium RH1A]|nr:DNA polymerase III subunit epsilon [Pasteurellaceae bacterium RH1A]
MNTFVAIDFETANHNRSSVCSVGLVFVEQGKIVSDYYRLIQPEPNFYNEKNTEIHGITPDDTALAAPFPIIWQEIQALIGDLPLVAHNSTFDESCLKAVLTAYDLPLHQNRFYCTRQQAKKVFPHLPNHQLKTVASHIGFGLSNHHHALADAQACAAIALRVF